MKTPLAWNNLIHGKVRTAAAIAGVTFAVVLIFLQLGFLGATEQTASLVYDTMDFDLLLRSRSSRRLAESQPFPRSRLDLAATVPGVREVHPFYIGFHRWRIPTTGYGRRILTMGIQVGDPVFANEELQRKTSLLTAPEYVLIDRLSRKDFGPVDGKAFGDADIGTDAEVGYHRVRLVGHYALGASFEADGSLVLSDEGFLRLYRQWPSDALSLGLVKIEPGQDPEAVAERVRQHLFPDTEVFTKAGIIAKERRMWLWEMSIGMIFFMGVAVALVVGVAIVYQILSSDVTSHLPEYATLKAIGYRDRFLGKVVLQQAILVSLLGFLPGLIIAEGLYRLTNYFTMIPITMTLPRLVAVLGMSVVMCGISGLAALRKLQQADPADLF